MPAAAQQKPTSPMRAPRAETAANWKEKSAEDANEVALRHAPTSAGHRAEEPQRNRFFFPLISDQDGVVKLQFTMPSAHDVALHGLRARQAGAIGIPRRQDRHSKTSWCSPTRRFCAKATRLSSPQSVEPGDQPPARQGEAH